jgi:hypothetical protein
MRAILVRVGVDQAYGKWNAPLDLRTMQFVYVPIPDGPKKAVTVGHARLYNELQKPIEEFAHAHKLKDLHLPDELQDCNMHLDPDFEYLTYGDNGTRRGAGIASLCAGDLLVFYASLRSITPLPQLIYGLIGLFVIDEVACAMDITTERRHENAHTRWAVVSKNDVVVRGRPQVSGRLDRCIPIGSWREKAYRVCPELEDEWGGLTVKNGYIQRSAVPPEFKDAGRFLAWFQQQGVGLSQRRF